ncbi:MAG: metal-dependent hydrolase [Deltaproteobacteria bacterium]|nr:metal-dependent hydrolase [Deltaproteobacteria bacterium]
MDTFSHLVSGGLVSGIVKSRNSSSRLLWVCLVSAAAPDVQFVADVLGPEFTMIHHQGITLSVFGGLFIALLLTWMFWLRRRPVRFWFGFVISYGLISLNIFGSF